MKRFIPPALLMALLTPFLGAQENLTYQIPPKEILELVDVQPAPTVMVDEGMETMVLLYRQAFTSIGELSKKELRLGGLRIDPATGAGSRVTYHHRIGIVRSHGQSFREVEVEGLPEKPRLANFSWSPDQQKMAFTHTTGSGVELWLLDLQSARATRLTEARLNAGMGDVINWFGDGQWLLVKMIPGERMPLIDAGEALPDGPTVSEADGRKAQNRTYQDLLKNKTDEHNFEQLALSELHRVSTDGSAEKWLGSAMYTGISFSPDGSLVMVTTLQKPFSYLVPYSRFPSRTTIYRSNSELVKVVLEVPLTEALPPGFMAVRTGKREMAWRADRPSTLVYVEALDGGDPEQEADFRDELFQWEAPFDGSPLSLLKMQNRFSDVRWGNERLAIATDTWWNNRNTRTYVFNPSDPAGEAVILFDRNYQDRYSDPGNFVTRRNKMGSRVLALDGNRAFLLGSGYSAGGQFPFLDRLDLVTRKNSRLYQSGYTDKLETLTRFDVDQNRLLVRIESASEFPNYYFRDLKKGQPVQVTAFGNPFRSIQEVHKEVITYHREDGLELSGTLYLPAGYDRNLKQKLPMILWAYPTEFKDKASAGQTTANPNRFTYPGYGSPIFWVTRGYAILDGASFPIVGEGKEEPNDSFRQQLVANAKAAIDAVDRLGYIDRERVAVGGHSYGAFMVANLLSHSDLFAAGIARSGAYNRTLTPFGFQSEERNYWEAPGVYYTMSPFMHADKMKTPLLLIHGEADNNSGTYPLQSTRYFNALKGLGATVRLVMLPMESHGYRARESILHMLWEQDQWLEKHVKNP